MQLRWVPEKQVSLQLKGLIQIILRDKVVRLTKVLKSSLLMNFQLPSLCRSYLVREEKEERKINFAGGCTSMSFDHLPHAKEESYTASIKIPATYKNCLQSRHNTTIIPPCSSIYTESQQHLLISTINLHFSVILNFLECNIPNNFPKTHHYKGFF